MYTQCPDCDTAFRVTAPVLQQGDGCVLCNGCGHTFNAIEHLTEDPPAATTPGSSDDKAVLDSLSELTGPHEIRIEDTGVEWRVIDEEELDDPVRDDALEVALNDDRADDTDSLRWFIEDRVDESALATGGGDAADSGAEHEQRYDDNTPLPEEPDADSEQAGAPQRRAEDLLEPRSPEADEMQVDLALGEPEEWMDLLEEEDERRVDSAEAVPGVGEALADTDVRTLNDREDPPADQALPLDIDTQFELRALELGIDVSGARQLSDKMPAENPDLAGASQQEEEASEQDLATDGLPEPVEALSGTGFPAGADTDGQAPTDGGGTPRLEDDEQEIGTEDGDALRSEQAFEEEFSVALTPDDEPEQDQGDSAKHYVPPPTKEEMTINLLIDQDLIRMAAEQDVFTSMTSNSGAMERAPHIETIIMEGEVVRSALDAEAQADRRADALTGLSGEEAVGDTLAQPADAAFLMDTGIKAKQWFRGGRRRTDPPGYGVISGVAVLALVLAAQVVHAYRDSLATYGAFDKTVGSVYRFLGDPLIPDWNVKGWQFKSTRGSTDADDGILTISSLIANNSDRALPYPLLHVSLTDRWEEIIGSKLLQPGEYLGAAADVASHVPAGEDFAAVVRVESPSPEATGFKLNVCYRHTGNRVRCATEDFRH